MSPTDDLLRPKIAKLEGEIAAMAKEQKRSRHLISQLKRNAATQN